MLLTLLTLTGQMAVVPAYRGPIPPVLRHYVAQRAATPIVIDGAFSESGWAAAPWSEVFGDIEGDRRPPPRHATHVRMLWDDSFLYIGVTLEEPDLWATLTTRDAIIFHDNDFEVFLDPDGDTHGYFELEVNALNTVWDLRLVRPYRDGGPALHGWDIVGLRTAVRLEGTLNDPGDHDTGWTVEMAIPWTALAADSVSGRLPKVGEHWRVNFSRVQWQLDVDDGRYSKRTDTTDQALSEDNWVWSPQHAINMHMPEMWGIVTFVADAGDAADAGDTGDTGDTSSRWVLRRVYYQQRAFRADHGRWAAPEELDDLGAATLRLTAEGYVAALGAWRIQQDGRIWNDGTLSPR